MIFSGTEPVLTCEFFPPIDLKGDYVLGLVDFLSYNSIPNVTEDNNKITYKNKEYKLPKGAYEVKAIEKWLQENVSNDISLKVNMSVLKIDIKAPEAINFTSKQSLASLLGFQNKIYMANKLHRSENPVRIMPINSIRIQCNIISGSYINGKPTHTIHEFFPYVPAGYKIIETPMHIIYLPVNVRTLDKVKLEIVDQNNKLIDFNGEPISVRLHIKNK